MAAASAARTALRGQFGFSETALLVLVSAGVPSVQRFYKEDLFCSVAAAWLDSAAHTVTTALVAAIPITVGDADGGFEGLIYQ